MEIAAVNDRRNPAPELPIPKLTEKISDLENSAVQRFADSWRQFP